MTSSSTDLRAAELRATGQRVILREAGALQTLAGALDDSFAKALGLLMEAKGRVIVSEAWARSAGRRLGRHGCGGC